MARAWLTSARASLFLSQLAGGTPGWTLAVVSKSIGGPFMFKESQWYYLNLRMPMTVLFLNRFSMIGLASMIGYITIRFPLLALTRDLAKNAPLRPRSRRLAPASARSSRRFLPLSMVELMDISRLPSLINVLPLGGGCEANRRGQQSQLRKTSPLRWPPSRVRGANLWRHQRGLRGSRS